MEYEIKFYILLLKAIENYLIVKWKKKFRILQIKATSRNYSK